MYQSIEANLSEKITKILISEESYISWVDFYTAHLGTQMNNILSCSHNDFHDNSIVNFIFILWFTTPLGRLADFMITSIKKIRAIKYKSIKSAKSVKDLLDGPKLDSVFSPIGVTRLVHKSKFLVDYSKAKKVIGYSPIYTFEKGTAMLMKEIKE
jgi:hypothetical protein